MTVLSWAYSDIYGRYMALEHDYDIFILDVMLRGKDGWQALSESRQKHGYRPANTRTPNVCSSAS